MVKTPVARTSTLISHCDAMGISMPTTKRMKVRMKAKLLKLIAVSDFSCQSKYRRIHATNPEATKAYDVGGGCQKADVCFITSTQYQSKLRLSKSTMVPMLPTIRNPLLMSRFD